MTATTLPEQVTSSATRRTANRPGRMLVLNLAAVAAGLGVWALLSVVIGVQGLPGPVEVARRVGELIADGTLAEDMLFLSSVVAALQGWWTPTAR